MIDPITAISAASTAFTLAKKAVAVGRDMEDMWGHLSRWASNIEDAKEYLNQEKEYKKHQIVLFQKTKLKNKKNFYENFLQLIGNRIGVALKAIEHSLKNAERLKKRENKLFTVRCGNGKIFYIKPKWERLLLCYQDC